jgi:hypothetical protein
MATPWTSLTNRTSRSPRSSTPGHAIHLFYELGHILERLWIIYKAMLDGRPVPNSDEVLAQIEMTLRRVSMRQGAES